MAEMRDFAILFVHLIVTLARLARPGGLCSVVAESVLVRHQLLAIFRMRGSRPAWESSILFLSKLTLPEGEGPVSRSKNFGRDRSPVGPSRQVGLVGPRWWTFAVQATSRSSGLQHFARAPDVL
jgi:hypothetical protein